MTNLLPLSFRGSDSFRYFSDRYFSAILIKSQVMGYLLMADVLWEIREVSSTLQVPADSGCYFFSKHQHVFRHCSGFLYDVDIKLLQRYD